MTTLIWIIVAIVWIIGAVIAYKVELKTWENPKWENFMMSLAWPCLLPLLVIHWIHNM